MSSVGTSKGVLEIVKFAVHISVPIGLMYLFTNNNNNLQKIMGHRKYVVYPTETVRLQSPEELREIAKEIAWKRERDQAMQSLGRWHKNLMRNPQIEEA